jgi:hypothetical protein
MPKMWRQNHARHGIGGGNAEVEDLAGFDRQFKTQA